MEDPEGYLAWWVGAAIGGAVLNTSIYLIQNRNSGITLGGIGKAAATGAITGVAFGGAGKVVSKGIKALSKGAGKNFAKEPFVPNEYWKRKAPQNATPGSKVNHYREYNGKIEKSTVIYDDFGRQKYRIDHSNHSMPKDHSVPHLHEYKYGTGYHPEKGVEFKYNIWRLE